MSGSESAPTTHDDHVYLSLAEGHDDGSDARWAFGTGFEDPLYGVDTTVPDGVDAGELAATCVELGDDALVSAQRLAQWCTRAPELEEEVALANIGLDLLGQARLLYARAGQVDGTGRGEDAYAYFRDAGDFRNVRLAELPIGDFAFSIARLLVLSTLAARALRTARRAPRSGARRDRREGRQGADVPPAVRGRVGRPARRRHRRVAPADARGPGPGRPVSRRVVHGVRRPGRGRRAVLRQVTDSRPGCPCRSVPTARGAGRDGAAHRASRPAARRVAERGPRPPGGDMVTVTAIDGRPARPGIAERVPDPELPMLTLADLGVLRDVEMTGDGTVVASLTPTYSGCPAMAEMRAAVAARLRAAGYARVEIRTVLDPPWTQRLDHRSRPPQAHRARHRPARRRTRTARPVLSAPAHPAHGALPPLRLAGHRGDLPLRRHVLQGPVALPRLPRAVRVRQGDLMAAPTAPTAVPVRRRPVFHALKVADVRRLCADAVAVAFEVPGGPGRGVRLHAGPVAHPAPAVRRARGAALVLDLRPGRRTAPYRRTGGARRAVLVLAGRRRAARGRARGR